MTDALKVMNLDGVMGIQESTALSARLLDYLDTGNNVILNMAQVASLDLSCLQVILAAKRHAKKRGLSLQLANQLSPEVLFSLYTCGLIKQPSLSGKEVNKAMDEVLGGGI